MGRLDIDKMLKDLGIGSAPHDSENSESASTGATPQASGSPPTPPPAAPDTIVQSVEGMAHSIKQLGDAMNGGQSSDADTLNHPHSKTSATSQGSGEMESDMTINEATPESPLAPSTDELEMLELSGALTPLWSPDNGTDTAKAKDRRELGDILLAEGIITAVQLENARSIIKQTPGQSLAPALAEMGIDGEPIQRIVAELNDLPFERIEAEEGFHFKMTETLGVEFCRVQGILPLRREGRWIILAMTKVDDVFLLDEIRRKLGGSPIKPVLVPFNDITRVLEESDEESADDPGLDDLLADIAEDDVAVVEAEDDDDDFEREAGESPVIRYVNYIIQAALKEGASDIHIEPGETKLKVRFRIDGILFDRMTPVAKMHAAIISRIKIMANLDIAERRMPQDGRIRAVVGSRKIDLRVSTLPTVAGEKCVMRILDSRSISVGLDQLGFSEDTLTIWKHQIVQPHGIILVTGPTGSGKTTTLYSSLREMDGARLNISTVEDPVEYHLASITQTQTHEKIGFTFASALRSLLRQDPDVVMIGEIRDSETARIAVQASLTGHLVLSTLHTNDAPSSITRLINIGVEPFLIGSALNAVLAQRLVRRICPECKVLDEISEEKAEFLLLFGQAGARLMIGQGCSKCRQTGYTGRLGIYELLMLDDTIRDLIAKSPNVTEFRRICIERGMISLRHDGMMKVIAGETTIAEVLRVTESTI